MEIYLAKGEQKAGPFSIQQVNAFYAASQVGDSDLAWYNGCQDWIPVSTVPGLLKRSIIKSLPPIPKHPVSPLASPLQSIVQGVSEPIKLGAVQKPAMYFEIILIALPVISTMLIWVWVANMNLLQSPSDMLALILVATIIGTAIVAAMEANKVGMVSVKSKGSYGPTAWFILIACMWVIGYPFYLFKRKHFGLANRLVVGVVLEIVFMASYFSLSVAIEERKTELRGSIEQIQRDLNTSDE